MSHFSMFVPSKATVKLANVNTGYAQVIGIFLCRFPSCYIVYPVVPVYHFPGHPSNTISSGALKIYVDLQTVTSEPLEHCDFVEPPGCYWRSSYHNQNNIDYPQIEFFKVNPHRDRNIGFPTVCAIFKKKISAYSSALWSCIYCHTKTNGKKSTHRRSSIKFT